MKQEEKQLQQALGRYVPPALEVVHLQVERGFATSAGKVDLVVTELSDNTEDGIEDFTLDSEDWF